MSRKEQNKVLVLNKGWAAIAITTMKRAISIVSRDHGRVVDTDTYQVFTWAEWLENKSFPVDSTVSVDKLE